MLNPWLRLVLVGSVLLAAAMLVGREGDVANDSTQFRVTYHRSTPPTPTIPSIEALYEAQAVWYNAVAVAYAQAVTTPTPTEVYQPLVSGLSASVRQDAGQPSGGEWRSLVCAAEFTWPCEWALAVIDCESGGNPNAIGGPEYVNGIEYYFYGLFQVVSGSLDPYTNARQAQYKYTYEGTGAWPNCP